MRTQEVPMSQNPGSLREYLLGQNDEFRRLDQEHHDYESRLQALTAKAVLSDEEQIEETTLKKKKLQVKDRMEAIARQAREGVAHP
jgi:hypothetical protein